MIPDPGLHVRAELSPLYRPIVFTEPDRSVDPASWIEHVPFAFWIVDALQPDIFVELGTHSGNSYSAFAQAVQALRLPTACYAIDTWTGDAHSGLYDEGVFAEWRDYHEAHFSGFSRLIRASFADALKNFTDGSIDLLHLDGYHTFGAVSEDFATWLPKMSRRGVMLLHDINVREGDFGAWRLWQQLEGMYPSFAFLHGHGLGVLGVGADLPGGVRWLLDAGSGDAVGIREFFSRRGRQLVVQHTLKEREQAVRALEARIRELETALSDEAARRDQIASDLEERRQSGRACLDLAIGELELRAEDGSRRDRAIRELDAEVRALASRLAALQARAIGRRSWSQRAATRAATGLTALRRTRVARGMSTLPAAPPMILRALRGGGWRDSAGVLTRFGMRPGRLRDATLVARSGLFDENYYLGRYPDVAASLIDPLIHYVLWGAFEGRQPHPLFDPTYYLAEYPDVARAGLEPLSHFVSVGGAEGRNPSPHFDSQYHLVYNADVRESGVNPLLHFVSGGWREGRSPSAAFDCTAYTTRYADVKSSGINPLIHYVEIGEPEDRDGSPFSDAPMPPPARVRLASEALADRRPERPVVVCLSHVSPWPQHAGNAYRVNRLLNWLQRDGFAIVPVIVPLHGETPDADSVRRVEQQFSNVVVVDRGGGIRYSLKDVPDVLATLDGEHTPRYSLLLNEEDPIGPRARDLLVIDRTYCPDAAIATILRLHSALGPYVLLTEYVWMTRVLPLIDDRALKVIDTVDVFSSKAAKVLRFGIRDLWLSEPEEARRLTHADLVIAIQEEERETLQSLVSGPRIVTTAIDFDVSGDPALPDGCRVLFVASGNPMNVQGLKDFLRFAWPGVRQDVPDAELLVAGAVSEAIELDQPGVRVLGRVDDLAELYRSARVVINPVLAGTGLKIKTVEALSRLRPIVTWPTGVEGLPETLKTLCDVVDNWYEFGPRVVSRLTTDRTESFTAEEVRQIAIATSPETVYAELSTTLRELWTTHASTWLGRASGPTRR